MANIVLNSSNELISVHDDDVELGPAYDSFNVVKMEGLDKKDIHLALKESNPDTVRVKGVDYWVDGADLREIKTEKERMFDFAFVKADTDLFKGQSSKLDKLNRLKLKTMTLKDDLDNQVIKV